MPPIPPNLVLSPKNQIAKVDVIHDGTSSGYLFSIAKLTLRNGQVVLGVRYDVSEWSPNPDNGYPNARGYASWFVLPEKFSEVFSKFSNEDLRLDSI